MPPLVSWWLYIKMKKAAAKRNMETVPDYDDGAAWAVRRVSPNAINTVVALFATTTLLPWAW